MKPAIVWRFNHREAFERALELRFGGVPGAEQIIETFRQQLVDSVERSAVRRPIDPAAEFTVKYGTQRMGYQKDRGSPPAPGAKEDWLEVRFRIIDEQTAEITSVTSKTLP
jgi:hypothetical protein